jgi:hypothetical protein
MISTSELKNYAFTIQIPAFKKVNFNDIYQPYKDFSSEDQENFIYQIVRHAISDFDSQHFEIKFEKHKDGRVHAHGTLYQLSVAQIEDFTDSICFCIGIKTPKQKKECCYIIPILCSYVWDNYIKKEEEDSCRKDFSQYLFGKINK